MTREPTSDHASERPLAIDTVAVVAGRPTGSGQPLNEPLVLASNFRAGPDYARTHGTRTWEALEDAIGALEGGQCVSFASGLAAAHAIVFALRPRVILIPEVSYLGVRALLQAQEERGQVDIRFLASFAPDHVRETLRTTVREFPKDESGTTDLGDTVLWLESPANPTLEEADLTELCALAAEFGVATVVDSTFASPVSQQPLDFGATVVMHSATKFIGGHSDLLLGLAIARNSDVLSELRQARTLQGATPGALESFLALRGLRTLPLRYRAATENACRLAERLSQHRDVTWVRQVGPMVSFVVAGGAAAADAVCDRLRLIVPATSLGGVETTLERRQKYPGDARVDPALIRMSVGIEFVEDLWADLVQAMG
ncbi:MAG: trans-sulfuration enzyme family protein [Ilumatobacteraceae bacterium]